MNLIKRKKIIALFICFFIFLLIQSHFIWLFHDDYGYASLSYIPSFIGNKGMNTSLLDIIKFLLYHYQNWGGRVLYFFLEIIMLRLGLPFYRFFQSFVSFGIFYLIYRIISKKTKINDFKLALFCILCYGVFEIVVIRGGIFWITASVLYFFPLFPFLLFIYLYDGKNKKILCAILIFLSTWSQEQIAVLSLSYIFLYTIHNYILTKKINYNNIAMFFSSLVAFLILILSSGSAVRVEKSGDYYSGGLIQKIIHGIPDIIINNFGSYTKIFTLLFFISGLYLIYKNKKNIKIKIIYYLSFISTYIIIVLNIFLTRGYFESIYYFKDLKIYRIIIIGIFLIQISLVFFNIMYYFYNKKQYMFIYLFSGGIMSQLTMIVAPYFPIRSVTMFEVVCFIIFGYIFAELLINKKINISFILIPFIIITSLNLIKITYGYYSNYYVHKYNDTILRKTSIRIKKGENIEAICLKKLNNLLYGIEEPYVEGFDYIEYYMKYYYDLPQEIEFIYE